jgi:4-carboxymuconolactone decarboxylase
MARLPLASRDSVPEKQRADFDDLMKTTYQEVPRYGPASVMIHVPKVHKIMNALNHYLRDDSSLPKKVQELAMLLTARACDCAYVWNAHAASARAAGVPDALVDALRERQPLPPLADDERAVVRFATEYYRNHHVSRGAFQDVMEQFGKQGAIELGLILGNYSALTLLINAFDVELAPQRKEPLMPI